MPSEYSMFPLQLVAVTYFDTTNSRNTFRLFVTITASVQFDTGSIRNDFPAFRYGWGKCSFWTLCFIPESVSLALNYFHNAA